MVVGSLQMLQSVPRPNESVVQEALNLLSVLGGGTKEAQNLLNLMKEVQSHNERVLAEAKAAIAEAKQREERAASSEEELARKVRAAESLVAGRYQALANDEAAFAGRMEVEVDELREGEAALLEMQEAHRIKVEEDERRLADSQRNLSNLEEEVKKSLDELDAKWEEYRAREAQQKEDELALAEQRSNLENVRLRLDARDERLRAAMAGGVDEDGR